MINKFISSITIAIFITIALLTTNNAYAANDFSTSYDITYRVNNDISVSVEQKVSLINKLANVYASQYQITLNSTRVRGIWAKDEVGSITPEIEEGSNFTRIKIKFNQKIVGRGNALNFSIGYISDDYAMKNGRVLEIGIPKIAEVHGLDNYNVSLIIPKSFENPAFINPVPTKKISTPGFNSYIYNNLSFEDESITAAFGDFQVFNFSLNYHLTNSKNNDLLYEIALPPDTPFQKVTYNLLKPQPKNVTIDKDGNWLASYILKPTQTLDIVASGSAQIYMKPKKSEFNKKIDFNDYLKPLPYWEVDDEEIKTLSAELKSPQNIYKFVADDLIYDYAKVEVKSQRQGAKTILNNKSSAICMDFTDLFIALCRAAGVPAREVNGFAYTNNPKLRPLSLEQDILHSWPQYYDTKENIWISVDPTWGNTTGGIDFFNKLDLNHFAFVFHGLDSEYPLTPGSYKNESNQTKDIQIEFGEDIEIEQNYNISAAFPSEIIAGKQISGEIKITNTGNSAIYNKVIYIDLDDQDKPRRSLQLNILPPFAVYSKKLNLMKTNIFDNGVKSINVKVDNQSYHYAVKINSLIPKPIAKIMQNIINLSQILISKIKKI